MQIKKHKLTTIVLLLVTLCLSLGLAACSRTCSHSYSDWATSKVATCTESGEKTRACDKCGNEEKEKIAALGHDFSKEWTFDDNGHWHVCLRSNCTAKSDETNHVDENNDHNCDTCGKTLSGHTGGTATCQQKATCAVCGEKYGELDSTNHEKGLVWTKTATTHEYAYECCNVITVANEAHEWQNGVCTECEYVCQHTGGTATCQQKATCAVCGEKYGELDSTNHEKGLVWTKTATTHEYAYECCNVITVANEAHEWKNGVCTECEYVCQHTGGTATCQQKATCTVCGEKYGDLLSHNVVLDTAKGVDGYTWATDYSSCTAHGKCDRTGCAHTINATATVSRLKKQAQSCVNAEIYDFTATFTETWAELQTKENVQTNDAAGHDYGDLITANPVSCTGDGNHAYFHCKACDGYFDENKNATDWDKIYIKSNGHDYGDLVHNPATCTESGYDDYYYCSACKTYFDAEKVPTTLYDLQQDAIEHVNNEYFESKAATCIATGNEEYLYCPDCKNYLDIDFNVLSWDDDIVIAKVDHAYGTIVHNPATCTEDGYNDYYQCSVCKAYFDSVKEETTLTALAVSATGHHYTDTVISATCSATGYTNHECACGDNYKDATTAKLDHNCNDLDICSLCNKKIFELNFTLSADESYYIVSGIKHGKTATTFEIPAEYEGKPVREIGESAFEGNTKLTNVTIPESVTIIGANAFKDCTNLVANIGSQLTSIGNYAFSATAITSVTIPDGITTINEGVFYNCTKLTNVTIPESVTIIGANAFKDCTNLDVIIAGNLQTNTGGLYTINKDSQLSSIGNYAFSNTAITTIAFPNSIKIINEGVFDNCTKLGTVYFHGGITEICAYAFRNTGVTKLPKITQMNSIGKSAFEGCSKLTTFSLYGLKTVNERAFAGTALSGELVIPYYIKSIAKEAFMDCKNITKLTVEYNEAKNPEGLNWIRDKAFFGCTSLTEVDVKMVKSTIGYASFGGCTSLRTLKLPFVGNRSQTTNKNADEGTFGYIFGGEDVIDTTKLTGLTTVTQFYNEGKTKKCVFYIPSSIRQVVVYRDKYIWHGAFSNCTMIESIDIQLGTVKTNAFYGCTSLKKLEIPIGSSTELYTFFDNSETADGSAVPQSLKYVTVRESDDGRLDSAFFEDCTGITDITIGEGITSVGRRLFGNCTNLKNVVFSNDVTHIEPYALSGCNALESLTIPFVGTDIDPKAEKRKPCFGEIFGYIEFTGAYEVPIPSDYVDNYPNYYVPTTLTTVTITGGVIEKLAFAKYNSITTVGLKNVSWKQNAFYMMDNLDNLYLYGQNTNTENTKLFNSNAKPKNLYVESLETWLTMPYANQYLYPEGHIYVDGVLLSGEVVIPGSVTEIADYVFAKMLDITSVVFEEGVEAIGARAFNGCVNIRSVTLPSTLKTIGNEAFEGCVNIENISLPVGIESIGSYAFSGLSKITEINLGSDLKFLGSYAFNGCTGLTQVTIPDSVTQEQSRIFDGCTNLLTVSCPAVLANGTSLPTTVKYLTVTSGDWSFGKKLSSLVTLTIGDGVTSIGEDLCGDSTELKTVTIGSGLANWGVGAFSNCGKLESFTISANNPYLKIQNGGIYATSDNVTKFVLYLRTLCKDTEYTVAEGVTEISRYAFNNATSLKKVVIPSTCKKIGHYAFNNCTSLESATLPNGLLEIWGYAFYNCTSLKNVTLPDSLTTIDGYAFNYCKSITGVLTMSKNLTYLGEHAFTHCSGITEVNLNKKLTTYGYGIFQACSSLKIIRYYTPIPDDRIIVSTSGVQMIQLTD